MKQGRCKGDIFFAPAEGEIRCAGTVDNFIATFFYQFHPFSLIAPRFGICSSINVLFGLSNLESPSFSNLWCILSMSNLWRHVGANLRIFTHIKYQRHQVMRRVTKRPLNQQRSLQMLNCIRIAWISRNWHTLKVFHHFWKMTFLTNFWGCIYKERLKNAIFQ